MTSDERLSTMSFEDLRALQDKLGKRILALASEKKQEAIKKVHGLGSTQKPYSGWLARTVVI